MLADLAPAGQLDSSWARARVKIPAISLTRSSMLVQDARSLLARPHLLCAAGLLLVSGCDTSRPIVPAGGDQGPDLVSSAERTGSTERGASADLDLSFPAVLEGVWLVGWSGGMNHYSWIRFSAFVSYGKKSEARVLVGKEILSNTPYFGCGGQITWWMGAAARTAYLDFPSTSCDPSGIATVGYVFSEVTPPDGSSPPGTLLKATLKEQATLKAISGFKLPADTCDAAMTTCKSPF
jgi:hypothetical protein